MQVFDLLPTDTLRAIISELKNGGYCDVNELKCNVLRLTAAILDQWVGSCKRVVDLRTATVPDVACVLKLINRLPHHPEIEVLHLPLTLDSSFWLVEDIERVLDALDVVLPAPPKLRVLGLYGLKLTIKA